MWYSIVSEFVPDGLELRNSARPAHLARLRPLVDAGRVFVAGPNPALDATDPGPAGFSGSLVIAEFPSLAEAEAWAESDPYVTVGLCSKVVVKPFIPVLP